MTAVEFAYTVTNLPAEMQNKFFDELKNILEPDEYIESVKFISFIGLFRSPNKYKAMRTALCEELFGMEVPFTVKGMFEE